MSTLSYDHLFVSAKHPQVARTLLLLHGTGGDENDLLPIGQTIAPDANLLSPRGKVQENGMNRFFRRFAAGELDVEDLRKRTDELADFVREAAKSYGFEAEEVIAVGFSNGANMAASMLFQRPEALSGAVLFRPMLPYEPGALTPLAGKPVLILGGSKDKMIPRASTEKLAQVLKVAGAAVNLRWIAAEHGLVDADIGEAKDFLRL